MVLNARRLIPSGDRAERILLVIEDATERKRAEEELKNTLDNLETRVRERTEELQSANASLEEQMAERRALVLRLATAEEDERRRIARELHDEMGQHITALTLELKLLEGSFPADSAAVGRLGRLREVTNHLGSEVHRIGIELRPPSLDDHGLAKTLQNYLEDWSRHTNIQVDFHNSGFDKGRAPSLVETAVYRVVQEALTNVLKHAAAATVSVILERRDQDLRLIIEDDGRGFDPDAVRDSSEQPHLGLLGMRERVAMIGGTIAIESRPEGPTTIFIRIPLDPTREHPGDA